MKGCEDPTDPKNLVKGSEKGSWIISRNPWNQQTFWGLAETDAGHFDRLSHFDWDILAWSLETSRHFSRMCSPVMDYQRFKQGIFHDISPYSTFFPNLFHDFWCHPMIFPVYSMTFPDICVGYKVLACSKGLFRCCKILCFKTYWRYNF